MKTLIHLCLAVSLCTAGIAVAKDFDGSKPLLCASTASMECARAECLLGSAETINLPQFFRINFKEKKVSATVEGKEQRTTPIERTENFPGKLIMQGAEPDLRGDGLGWTMAISEASGKMVLTASGDDVAFVVFGACTPL